MHTGGGGGGQDCYHIIIFSGYTMFELQQYNYYEIFSQCFYTFWWVKTQKIKWQKNYAFLFHVM